MRIFIGLLGMGIGFLMIRYHMQVRPMVGTWGWAEKLFGTGGTYMGIRIVGILVIITSFIYMTGTAEAFLKSVFSRPVLPSRGIEAQ
ncbi:MAG: hypothetical protein ACK4NC_05980 [Candidatus Gracilibacteria bacterium]